MTDDQSVEMHRTMGPVLFNKAWEYLDQDQLSPENEADLLAATFGQRYHWYQVGAPRNFAIADWQIARALTVLGYFDLARRFAKLSLQRGIDDGLGPFIVGFGHEALARVAAEVDDVAEFDKHIASAREFASMIEDDEEQKVLTADLDEMTT